MSSPVRPHTASCGQLATRVSSAFLKAGGKQVLARGLLDPVGPRIIRETLFEGLISPFWALPPSQASFKSRAKMVIHTKVLMT